MERKKASDFPPEVMELFDGYVHGAITRRDFLDRAARYAVGGLSAAAMLQSLTPNFAWANQVSKDDGRIKAGYVDYDSPQGSGKMRGYLARPAKDGRAPGVVVIHENRGLSPYIEDVARRLAVEGYVALAPDALAPMGGYPGDEDKAREMFGKLDPAKMFEDLAAAHPHLKSRPECNGATGAIGFCLGGEIVNRMAVRFPELRAAVPFYGPQPASADAAKVRAAMQLHFAEKDPRVNAGRQAWEDALKAAGVKVESHVYPGTQHGFHNDTTPRYDEAAARLAWSRALAWFKANLA
jgi:carboxymethylenebutenolidase